MLQHCTCAARVATIQDGFYLNKYSIYIYISCIDLFNQIAADLRSVVPPTAIAPDEAQHYPTVGQVLVRKRESCHCILSICV